MLIYLDESFDRRARYMCLGALFLPDEGPNNAQMEEIKNKYRQFAPGHSFSDVKYSKTGDDFTFAICKEIIDLFISQAAWFRALVLDTSLPGFSWSIFGGRGTRRSLTKARAYNRLVGMLLQHNLEDVEDAILLADSLTPMAGDDFVSYISGLLGPGANFTAPASATPAIRDVQRVDTSLPGYQMGQMCDVLLGVITGDLAPPANRNKRELVQYAKDALGIGGFGPDYWHNAPERQPDETNQKFHVWHWQAT